MLVSCSWGGVPASSRPPPGGWRYTPGSSCTRGHSTLLVIHRRKKKEEKENVVAAGWRDELECRTSKNDLKKKRFWENIHFGRVVVWYGVSRMIINFSTHPFRQVFYSSVSSSWCTVASAARNWINSIPQTAATIFAFSCLSLSFFYVKMLFYLSLLTKLKYFLWKIKLLTG